MQLLDKQSLRSRAKINPREAAHQFDDRKTEGLNARQKFSIDVELAELHVSRQLRQAYLAPEVLKRLVFGREVTAVAVM